MLVGEGVDEFEVVRAGVEHGFECCTRLRQSEIGLPELVSWEANTALGGWALAPKRQERNGPEQPGDKLRERLAKSIPHRSLLFLRQPLAGLARLGTLQRSYDRLPGGVRYVGALQLLEQFITFFTEDQESSWIGSRHAPLVAFGKIGIWGDEAGRVPPTQKILLGKVVVHDRSWIISGHRVVWRCRQPLHVVGNLLPRPRKMHVKIRPIELLFTSGIWALVFVLETKSMAELMQNDTTEFRLIDIQLIETTEIECWLVSPNELAIGPYV